VGGEIEVLRENLPSAALSMKDPHDLSRDRTRAAAVGSRRLTACATARPQDALRTKQRRMLGGFMTDEQEGL
jgi:hypothetical protein